MQFKQGANVVTASGDPVGTVDRVVINPRTKSVTDLIVSKGFLFTEDKVVSIDLIQDATEDQITLKANAGDLSDLPPFEESNFISLSDAEVGVDYVTGTLRPVYAYPPLGLPDAAVAGIPGMTSGKERNIPENTVALKHGASVVTADGASAGVIEQIFTDPKDDRATHLLISKGLLLRERKLIPATWIAHIEENQVQLAVNENLVQRLPPYQEEAKYGS